MARIVANHSLPAFGLLCITARLDDDVGVLATRLYKRTGHKAGDRDSQFSVSEACEADKEVLWRLERFKIFVSCGEKSDSQSIVFNCL